MRRELLTERSEFRNQQERWRAILNDKNLSYEEILQIVKVFESSSEFSEFHLKFGDIEVDLRKHGAAPSEARQQSPAAVDAPVALLSQPPAPPEVKEAPKHDTQALAVPAGGAFPSDAYTVKSCMVGTFYASPEPGAAPFVTVGQRVTPDTTVCIIEVMKLMTSIRAECAGVVTHILVPDANAVEFGQTLMVIAPNA